MKSIPLINSETSEKSYRLQRYIKDPQVSRMLGNMNITHLNPIQIQAIFQGLFFHKNMVVCSPSGSGKTLVALMGMANTLFSCLGTVIYLVPYKALASEKEKSLKTIFEPLHFSVKAITGDSNHTRDNSPVSYPQIMISTYEKLESMLRQGHTFLKNVKTIVIDEIHEMNSSHRGPRLEFMIIRLLRTIPFVQIIGLSATVANPEEFTNWLSSLVPSLRQFRLISSTKRPVELEYVMEIAPQKMVALKQHIHRVLSEGGQILIFVNSRRECVSLSRDLKQDVYPYLSDEEKKQVKKIKTTLQNSKSLAYSLIDCVDCGIAYHNASLGSMERDLVERYYIDRSFKVLVATTTLAAGINTPARTVIVYDIIQWRKHYDLKDNDYYDPEMICALDGIGFFKPHSQNMMFQMLGRAGRKGFDDKGEGIMFLKSPNELNFARTFYFQRDLKDGKLIPRYTPITSKINNPDFLQEITLVLASEKMVLSQSTLVNFLCSTLFYMQKKRSLQKPEDILQLLLIKRMNFPFFVRSYGNLKLISAYAKRELSIKLRKLSSEECDVTLNSPSHVFHITLSLQTGPTCSCCPTKRISFKNKPVESSSRLLCPHISTVFVHLYRNRYVKQWRPAYKVVKNIIPALANHIYVVPYLLRNKMLAQSIEENGLMITRFGKLSITMFFSPRYMIEINTSLSKRYFLDEESLISRIMLEYAKQTNKTINLPKLLRIIKMWMGEQLVEDIKLKFPKIGLGDIFHLKSQLERIATIFEVIADYNNDNDLAQMCKTVACRSLYGVGAELIPLMEEFPNLSRKRARILFENGYSLPSQVRQDDIYRIHQKTKIPMASLGKLLSQNVNKQNKLLLDFN